MCYNPKCNCQNQITFTSKHFHLEVAGSQNTMTKIFKGTVKMWNKIIKLGLT